MKYVDQQVTVETSNNLHNSHYNVQSLKLKIKTRRTMITMPILPCILTMQLCNIAVGQLCTHPFKGHLFIQLN